MRRDGLGIPVIACCILLVGGVIVVGEGQPVHNVVRAQNPGQASGGGSVELAPALDNTLYEHPTGGLSDGAGTFLFAGRAGSGQRRRAVLQFDVAGSVPPGSVITSARLTMNMTRTIVGPMSVRIHPLLASWGEGTSNASGEEGGGAPSTPGDATWVHRFFNTMLWAGAGGDFAPAASASISVGGLGVYTWGSTAAMVADVQGWLNDPASNSGWIVIGDESTSPTAKRFNSGEHATTSTRPRLTIEFGGPPVGSCCSGIGSPAVMCENDLTEGECNSRPAPTFFREGRVCEDNECGGCPECTQNDTCNDGNACTSDSCDVADGCCVNADNFNPATHCCDPDTGMLSPLDDENLCTGMGICDGQTGQVVYPPLPQNTPCDDGVLCTTNDRCNGAGACIGDQVTCNDGNACTANERCDPANGQCIADPPSTCSDGNACTRNDRCDPSSGGCAGDPISGQACSTDADCAPGACVDNRCQCPAGPGGIPTVSQWGMAVLAVALLAMGRVHFRRWPQPRTR